MTGFEIGGVVMNPPSFHKDKSTRISFETGEMSKEQKMMVLENDGQIGTMIFIPEEAQEAPPKIDAAAYEGKKPSERLRNVMFVYWKQQGSQGDFEQYYASQIEKFINAYKDKLDH